MFEQKWALITIGSNVLAPRPVDGGFPCLRVYGCFRTKADAGEHAKIVRGVDATCSLVILECASWFVFPQKPEHLNDPSTLRTVLERRMGEHQKSHLEAEKTFQDVVANRLDRDVNWRTDWSEEQEEDEEAYQGVYTRPKRLSVGAEVRGQTTVVLCCIKDHTGAGEIAIQIIGCFEGTREANKWAREIGSRKIHDHDLYIAQTCEWIYPNGSQESSERDHYRIGELQKIMDAASANPQNVRNFKEWKAEQDELKRLEHDAARDT